MKIVLSDYLVKKQKQINEKLQSIISELFIPERLKKSMNYSLNSGGKRIRPILLMATNEAYNGNEEKVLNTAIALEMIHTYSLIHDDLPAMDDDDFRRGKLTNHKKFDEATAVLAGDALLTYSFELISNDIHLSDYEKVKLISHLSKASGPSGMVGGQMLDLQSEQKEVALDTLEKIHSLKTGALLQFAVLAGAFLANATNEQLENLKQFSYYLGLIFQIQDDLLDVTGDEEKIGKPVGSDLENKKSTYPKLLGIEGATIKKNDYVLKAKKALEEANIQDSYLHGLIDLISERDH